MNLNQQLKRDSGYGWVVSGLETVSPLGHARVREPEWYGPGREQALEEELARVEQVLAWDSTYIDTLAHRLSEFRDIRNSFAKQYDSPMDVVELFEVKHFLLALERLAEEYACAPLSGVEIVPMDDMLALLDPNGRKLPSFHIENTFDPVLERIRAEKERVEQKLRENRTQELLEHRVQLVRQEDAAELDARRRLTAALLREKERFLANMDAVGRLDFVLAKGKLAKKFGCVKPRIGGEAVIVDDMVHPQVAEHLDGAFTPVSVGLERGAAVVTGANMGGKSVSLKAVALNLLLMQTGFFVFAKGMSSPLFDSVELIGGDEQSLERGLSSFGAEVKQLDETLNREKGKFFFLALDEFARGTNPGEGAMLARALVKHLNGLNCVAMLSTHYDGVASAAKRHYQVAGLDKTARKMDYRLVLSAPDAPCPQDALNVCRMLGLSADLMAAFEENG